jgi:Na+-transporting NADH:ubiquinone oxidoreductase subunit A
MSKAIKIKKGVDINLFGEPEQKVSDSQTSNVFALKPDDFFGMVPKLVVREGDEVKAGTPIFYDKKRENILFTSPVSGEVAEVKRGAKRKILEIKVLADASNAYEEFSPWKDGDKTSLTETMLKMGLWPFVKQRPYGIIANPEDSPRAIFISGFDSAPLAGDIPFILKDELENFQKGINALKTLTTGNVYLGTKKGSSFYDGVQGVEKNTFSGPHPSGNVGVQIHHLAPINKGEVIWTVNAADVAVIGKSLSEGKFRAERTIALAGSEVNEPQYYRTMIGAEIKSLTGGKLKEDNRRIISGNVLTGAKVEEDGHLGFFDTTVSVIPEGDQRKFFLTEGWLSPGFGRFSLSKAYPSWLLGNKKYDIDTNLNGEKRAFVVTGELEKVFPFKIFPMQLIKSIMVNDIDSMEKLGIYEVLPEDFALCEFACTSKVNIQAVVEQGLSDMRKEFA